MGDFGPEAFAMIDWLKAAGVGYWQILPLSLGDSNGCPYAAISSFGLDPCFISPELLFQEGLISQSDLEKAVHQSDFSAFGPIRQQKEALLRSAFEAHKLPNDLQPLALENESWLNDYSLFVALAKVYGQKWWLWPQPLRQYQEARRWLNQGQDLATQRILREMEFQKFCQLLLLHQWQGLSCYAQASGLRFIGDLPLFVAHRSMDCWRQPNLFSLDDSFHKTAQTGAPPDPFYAKGQCWGHPQYSWDQQQSGVLDYWRQRLTFCHQLYDVLRLDHFIGLAHTWVVPPNGDPSQGAWRKGPGSLLPQLIQTEFPQLSIIVEDLGAVDQEVIQLRDDFQLPGMRLLPFAFSGDPNQDLDHAPWNSVCYTSNHDTDTLMGVIRDIGQQIPEDCPKAIAQLLEQGDGDDSASALVEYCLKSPCQLAIVALQDVLKLGSEARINVPGTTEGNWRWQLPKGRPNHEEGQWLRAALTKAKRAR